MKATKENIGQTYIVRLMSYKSVRHYGGREITPVAHFIEATLVAIQDGYQPYVVTLNEDMKDYAGRMQYRKGHKIAVTENDFAL